MAEPGQLPAVAEGLALVPWEDMELVPTPARVGAGSLGGLYAATVPQAGVKRRAPSPTRGALELVKLLRRAEGSVSSISTSAGSSDEGASPQVQRDRGSFDASESAAEEDGACSASAAEDALTLLDSLAAEEQEEAEATPQALAPEAALAPEVARARGRAERARQNAARALSERLERQARAQQRRRVTGKRTAPAFPPPMQPLMEEAAEHAAEEADVTEELEESAEPQSPAPAAVLQTPTRGGMPWGTPAGSLGSTPLKLGCPKCCYSPSGCSRCRGKVNREPASGSLPGPTPMRESGVRKQGKLKEPCSEPAAAPRRRAADEA